MSTRGSFGRGKKFLVSLFLCLFEQEVSLLQVIQVLLDRAVDAKNLRRLDQLAKCAAGLCDRVEMCAVCLPLCVRVLTLRMVVPGTIG